MQMQRSTRPIYPIKEPRLFPRNYPSDRTRGITFQSEDKERDSLNTFQP